MTTIDIEKLVRCSIQLRTVKKDTLEYVTLRDAIRAYGIITPLIVRPASDRFEVVDGARRLEIALDERLTALVCNVVELTDEEVEVRQVLLNFETATTTDIARRIMRIIGHDKWQTVRDVSGMFCQHPDWVCRMLGLKNLVPRAKELVTRDRLPAAIVFELAKLPAGIQDTLLDAWGKVPLEAFIDAAQTEVRNLRSGARDARTLHNKDRKYRYRNLKESVNEYLTETVAASVLCSVEAKTALDGWRASSAWHLQDDLASRAKNHQSQIRRDK